MKPEKDILAKHGWKEAATGVFHHASHAGIVIYTNAKAVEIIGNSVAVSFYDEGDRPMRIHRYLTVLEYLLPPIPEEKPKA